MRNSTIMNTPAQAAVLAQPIEWTLPIIDPLVWHQAIPDYAKRMARMAVWCEEWMIRLS